MRLIFTLFSLIILTACAEKQPIYTVKNSYIIAETPTYAHLKHVKPLNVHKQLTSQEQKWIKEKQEQVFEETLDFEGRVFYKGKIALHLKPTPTLMRNKRYCRVIEESLRIHLDEWVSSYLACKEPDGTWVQINEPQKL